LEDRLRNHVAVLASDSLQGRGLGTDGTQKALRYIVEQFANAGIKPLPQMDGEYLQPFTFRFSNIWVGATNIIGYIEGSDPVLKNEFILIGAHYDHLGFEIKNNEKVIFAGADDNASGMAAIIELGRYFAERPHLLQRSLLIVAFDAEESGLKGSEYFVENSPVALESLKMMFSLDWVGMLQANKGLIMKGIASMRNGVDIVEQIAVNHQISLKKTTASIERRTDTAPFGDRGIPAVHIFTGTKSPYHKPEDQYHLLDYAGMVTIHAFMAGLLAQLSQKPEILPVYTLRKSEGKTKGRTLSFGVSLHAGSGFHRYDDQFYRANSLMGGAGGIYLRIPVSRLISLQQDILMDLNGSRIEGGNFTRQSITLPMNIQLGTPKIPGPDLRLYSFAGPYFRYSFAGKSAGETLSFEVFNNQEWGYSWGFAMDLLRFTFGYTYRRALTEIYVNGDEKVLDSNSYFSISYRF
jgi:aminopeptidase YwaD